MNESKIEQQDRILFNTLMIKARQEIFQRQLTDTPPESERQILRCAPPFDAQAEHENDLRQESLRDFYEQDAE